MGDIANQDAALVTRFADGDGDAFATIYERYLPLVVRWSLRQTENREVAADLAAEVFAAALIASPKFDPQKGPVAAWLIGIAKNKLRESRRRSRVEDAARRKLGIGRLELTDAALERVEELASLESSIGQFVDALPEDQRVVIQQRVVQERSYDEIASELGCSESVVRQRVSRGLRTLRSEMEER